MFRFICFPFFDQFSLSLYHSPKILIVLKVCNKSSLFNHFTYFFFQIHRTNATCNIHYSFSCYKKSATISLFERNVEYLIRCFHQSIFYSNPIPINPLVLFLFFVTSSNIKHMEIYYLSSLTIRLLTIDNYP